MNEICREYFAFMDTVITNFAALVPSGPYDSIRKLKICMP